MGHITSVVRSLALILALNAVAHAQPIELKDQNGTKYWINTNVDPLRNSEASGAITNATYVKPVTVTTYYLGLTPFGFFLTTYTNQRQVDVPLPNAFAGFNGLLIAGVNGIALPSPLLYNPGQPIATQECLQNNENRQLVFQSQTFAGVDLQVTRKVFVPSNGAFVRWLNIVTNLSDTPRQIGITLQGLLGSKDDTRIGTTSSGDGVVVPTDLWFTSGQVVPEGVPSTQPSVGFVVQGEGATAPAVAEGVNVSTGQAIVTYNPTIPAGGTVIIMTMTTAQGNLKQAKNTVENLVDLPSSTLKCMSEQELAQVVNFAPITPPETKNATIKLNFKKVGADTIQWKGKVTIAGGIALQGIPITVDVGGALQSFVLSKNGSANNGNGNKFSLQASLQNGLTKVGTYKVSVNMKGDFQAQLATYGLTNVTQSKVPVSVPLTFNVGTAGSFATDLPLTYKATEGKVGNGVEFLSTLVLAPRRHVRRGVLGALLAVGVVTGCQAPQRRNVVLVTIDTLRADRLGCYGFGLAHTPVLDRLAREGVRCTDVASAAPITLPAHCSIMTGLYPPAHGVRDNGNYALGPEAITLAERLHDVGYRTGAFVSAGVLARRYGLDQGFDVYDDELWSEDKPELFMIRERPASRTTDHALAWLETPDAAARAAPFFLWVHLFDPHQPYDVRSIDLAAVTPTPYDTEIAEVDRAIGRIVESLRQRGDLDDTLVVVTADHGESLGEHGEPTHGVFIYDATIRIPLIWRLPAVFPAATLYTGPVRQIDLVPTMLAVLGLAGGGGTQGTDLLAALQGRVSPIDQSQYSEARLAEEGFGMAPLFGLRHGGRKWIQAPHPELYDLRADPGELHNLHPADGPAGGPLARELEAVAADSGSRTLTAPTREIDRETEEMLRALGYLAPPEQRAEMGGMDPKDGMALYAKLQEARQCAQNGDWACSRRLLDEVLTVSPENVTARNVLALGAVRDGDYDDAERQYLGSLAQQPRQHRVLGALGSLAVRRGDLDEAERRFRHALELAPSYVEAMSNLGWIAAARGDEAGAQAWYERAIALDPTYPHVYRRLADLYYDRKDWPRASEYYRRVLTVVPDYFEVLIQAGNTARFAGDAPAAENYYTTAGSTRPDSWIPLFNLACLRAVSGDPDGALVLLDEAADLGFGATALLDTNQDFGSLRTLAGWAEVVAKVGQVAQTSRP